MSRQFLVDGYNVIKTVPRFADRTLEDGRNGLVSFIRERRPHGSGRNAVMVVFDGQEGVGAGLPDMSADVGIFFTRGMSADDHIRQCVEEAEDPRRIICVTDDRELAIACRHRGAVTWSVAQFMERGRREEERAVFRSGKFRERSGEAKVISQAAAQKIDRELAARWLKGV